MYLIAKMYVEFYLKFWILIIKHSVYKLHDEVKDKDFELELSWVCEESGRKHTFVPEDLRQDAINKAIAAKEREEEGSDNDMQ